MRRPALHPQMKGPNGSASYGQLVVLGIMKDAAPEAQLVVEYFLKEGYQDILALAPFGKVPVLKSAVDGWMGLSPFFENYSEDTLEQIANGYDSMQRWLFRPDYDATERAVVGDIEGRLLIPTGYLQHRLGRKHDPRNCSSLAARAGGSTPGRTPI